LIATVRQELKEMLAITTEPVLTITGPGGRR
jgi:hypothetical protein